MGLLGGIYFKDYFQIYPSKFSKLLSCSDKVLHQNLIFHILFHHYRLARFIQSVSPNDALHIPARVHPSKHFLPLSNTFPPSKMSSQLSLAAQFAGIFFFEQFYSTPRLFVQVDYKIQEGRNHPLTSFCSPLFQKYCLAEKELIKHVTD